MNKRLHYICCTTVSAITAIILSFTTGTTAAMAEQPTCEIKYTVFLPAFLFKGYRSIVQKAQRIVQNTTMASPNCDPFRKTVIDIGKLSKDYLETIASVYNTPKSKQHARTIIELDGTYIKIHILKDGLYAHVRIVQATAQEAQETSNSEKDFHFRGAGPFIIFFYD